MFGFWPSAPHQDPYLKILTRIAVALEKNQVSQQDLDAAITAEATEETSLLASVNALIAKYEAAPVGAPVDLSAEIAQIKGFTTAETAEQASADAATPAATGGTTPTV
jgi:hypothetical protein